MALRFLRGCKSDAAKAAHVLTGSLAWRREFGAGARDDAEDARVRAVFPFALHGASRGGHPVQIERTGLVASRPRSTPRARPPARACARVRANARALAACDPRVAPPQMRVVVLDLDGMDRSPRGATGSPCCGARSRSTSATSRDAPPRFIVNAPFLLKAVWALVAPWLDPHTQTKIQIFGAGLEGERRGGRAARDRRRGTPGRRRVPLPRRVRARAAGAADARRVRGRRDVRRLELQCAAWKARPFLLP